MRSQLTPTSVKLSNVEIVIDKMHMAGHIDKWCIQNCNPSSFSDLDKVSQDGLFTCIIHKVLCSNTRLIPRSVSNTFRGCQAMER